MRPQETSAQPIAADGPAVLPIFATAGVLLAFGLATVFWTKPAPSDVAGAWLSVALTLGLAVVALLWRRHYARLGLIAAVVLTALAAAQALIGGRPAMSLLAGIVFLAAGLFAFAASREKGTPMNQAISRDLLISALVLAGDGIILLFVRELGAHGQLGIAGGAAIIVGVLWIVSGISLKLDGVRAEAPA